MSSIAEAAAAADLQEQQAAAAKQAALYKRYHFLCRNHADLDADELAELFAIGLALGKSREQVAADCELVAKADALQALADQAQNLQFAAASARRAVKEMKDRHRDELKACDREKRRCQGRSTQASEAVTQLAILRGKHPELLTP